MYASDGGRTVPHCPKCQADTVRPLPFEWVAVDVQVLVLRVWLSVGHNRRQRAAVHRRRPQPEKIRMTLHSARRFRPVGASCVSASSISQWAGQRQENTLWSDVQPHECRRAKSRKRDASPRHSTARARLEVSRALLTPPWTRRSAH